MKKQNYSFIMASDIVRDGMGLELIDDQDRLVAEIFYSDVTHEMTFSSYRHDIPLEIVEWMITEARNCLIPEGKILR